MQTGSVELHHHRTHPFGGLTYRNHGYHGQRSGIDHMGGIIPHSTNVGIASVGRNGNPVRNLDIVDHSHHLIGVRIDDMGIVSGGILNISVILAHWWYRYTDVLFGAA